MHDEELLFSSEHDINNHFELGIEYLRIANKLRKTALFSINDLEKANECFSNALKENVSNTEALIFRSLVLFLLERFKQQENEQMIKLSLRLEEEGEEEDKVNKNEGGKERAKEKFEMDCDLALSQNPNHVIALCLRAYLHFTFREEDQAIGKLSEINPSLNSEINKENLIILIESLLAAPLFMPPNKQFNNLLKIVNFAILMNECPGYYKLRAYIHCGLEKYTEACEDFAKYIESCPNVEHEIHLWYAMLLIHAPDDKEKIQQAMKQLVMAFEKKVLCSSMIALDNELYSIHYGVKKFIATCQRLNILNSAYEIFTNIFDKEITPAYSVFYYFISKNLFDAYIESKLRNRVVQDDRILKNMLLCLYNAYKFINKAILLNSETILYRQKLLEILNASSEYLNPIKCYYQFNNTISQVIRKFERNFEEPSYIRLAEANSWTLYHCMVDFYEKRYNLVNDTALFHKLYDAVAHSYLWKRIVPLDEISLPWPLRHELEIPDSMKQHENTVIKIFDLWILRRKVLKGGALLNEEGDLLNSIKDEAPHPKKDDASNSKKENSPNSEEKDSPNLEEENSPKPLINRIIEYNNLTDQINKKLISLNLEKYCDNKISFPTLISLTSFFILSILNNKQFELNLEILPKDIRENLEWYSSYNNRSLPKEPFPEIEDQENIQHIDKKQKTTNDVRFFQLDLEHGKNDKGRRSKVEKFSAEELQQEFSIEEGMIPQNMNEDLQSLNI
jgi:hypothetical protein